MSQTAVSQTIVVIDDNEVVLQQFRRILGKDPARRVLTFHNPTEALEHCVQIEPDLVLTDYQMPDLDGLELIKKARGQRPLAPTQYVLITGSAQSELEVVAARVGAAEVIRLPASPSTIVDRVEARLSGIGASWSDVGAWQHARPMPASVSNEDLQALRCLERLAAFRDEETGYHTARMAHYSAVLAQACGQSQHFQSLILLAAPLHDIGKVGIPEEILRKSGVLDEHEWNLMKQHPVFGYEILREQDGEVFALGAEVALHHHERWDGTGYPLRLAGRDIPLSARIVAVADAFDALTSERRYKRAWGLDSVLLHLANEAGRHFDPEVVAAVDRSLASLIRVKMHFDSLPAESGVEQSTRWAAGPATGRLPATPAAAPSLSR
jgi:response regulator RpfG family c-di-GMP phosphodiesterase